uniref:Kinesin-like protein n=1 Tax=Panagrellus redivivus TaxID=6233 RepID=A0A7E4ZZG4_PANRE
MAARNPSAQRKTKKNKNVQVAVRVRPLNSIEKKEGGRKLVKTDRYAKHVNVGPNKAFGPFDYVYDETSTQLELYHEIVAPLINQVLSGYNCTVFAYGQTGTGKTFTMEGAPDDSADHSWETDPQAGIIPRSLQHIFTTLEESGDEDFSVRISYVELYNEELYDLLATGSMTEDSVRLRIFDGRDSTTFINGLSNVAVRNRDEVFALLKRGAERRRTASTAMNMNSSRSHSVFIVTVVCRDKSNEKAEEYLLRTGKLYLVDLAGSESIGRSGATDMRAREAGNINQSLLTLGRVINALTTSAAHIPYRESKLTRILQDSLGGKTITTIIATLSPSTTNAEESVSTLEYAQRAKNIKNNPEVNAQVTRKAMLKEYNEEVERLRRDLAAARQKNGIFISSENYEELQAAKVESAAKLEALEAELLQTASRMNNLVEDMEYVESQYKIAYERTVQVAERLKKRVNELSSERTEHERSKQQLKATRRALEEAHDQATRLYSEALETRELNVVISSELEVIHEKFATARSVFDANDKLFGEFSANTVHKLREVESACVSSAKEIADHLSEASETTANSTGKLLTQLKANYTTLHDLLKNVLGEHDEVLTNAAEEIEQRANDFEQVGNSCASKITSAGTKIAKTLSSTEATIQKSSETAAQTATTLGNTVKSTQEKYTTLQASIATMLQQLAAATEEANSEFTQLTAMASNTVTTINTVSQETVSAITNAKQTITTEVTAQTDASKSLVETITEAAGNERAQARTLTEKAAHFAEKMLTSHETYESTMAKELEAAQAVSDETSVQLRQHSNALLTESAARSTELDGLRHSVEHFFHQSVQRYESDGNTPARKKRRVDENLTSISEPEKLLENVYSEMTPIRKVNVRDSILVSQNVDVLSPATLKENIRRVSEEDEEDE